MRALVFVLLTGAFVAGCGGGGGGGGDSTPPELHSLGGTITGLHGTGLVLANNGGGTLTVPQGASTFTFASVASGTSFNVSVATQPAGPSQTCVVAHGSGTVSGTDVTNVAVSCTDNSFTVGGKVTGLVASGLTLALDTGSGSVQSVSVAAAGPYDFTFPNPVTSGLHYTVSVATTPGSPPQGCGVAHASGTVGSANVTDVAVGCNAAAEQLVVFGDTVFLFNVFIDPSTGAIALSSGAPTLVTANAVNLTIDPSRHFIYADKSGYRIDPSNGTPISIAMLPFNEGSLMWVPSGKFAYSLTWGSSQPDLSKPPVWNVLASVFQRDLATGVLTLLPPADTQAFGSTGGNILGATFIDASSSFAYVRVDFSGCSCYSLGGFAIDPVTGAVTANVPGALHLQYSRSGGGAGAIEPQGRYLLFASGLAAQAIIETFSIDANSGSLTKVSTVPQPSAGGVTTLAIHPNGKFVYVSDGANLWGYSLDAAGALTPIGVLALNIVTNSPGGPMKFDPSAQYLYVMNRAAKSIAGVAVDANTGSMALVPGSPLVFEFAIQNMVASWIP